MQQILLTSVEFGGYMSIIKFLVFFAMFCLALPMIKWTGDDAEEVGTDPTLWTAIVFGSAALSLLLWLLIPIFFVGLAIFVVGFGTAALVYVFHRNARVMEYERVLTIDHIKSLFKKGGHQKFEQEKQVTFITANKNQIPLPEPKTPEFYGYRAAYEVFSDISYRRADLAVYKPLQSEYSVTYTIDGANVNQNALEAEQAKFLISFLKALADLDVKEKRKPQKGKFHIKTDKGTIEWQIQTAGSMAGEQMNLIKMTRETIKPLKDIGLTTEQLKKLEPLDQYHLKGAFLVTGPQKSGTTTTFYSFLKSHDAFVNSITTIEKKTLVEMPDITQTTYTLSDTGTTSYARKLLSLTRTAPDIIGVADADDNETLKTAAEAASETMLYVNFKAASASQALVKWLKATGDRSLAFDHLLGVANQRLARKLCPECRQAYAPNAELLRKFNLPTEKAKVLYRAGKYVYDKHGKQQVCEECQGTGHHGRTAVFELAYFDDKMRADIKKAKSLADIESILRTAKMRTLQDSALRKVIEGTISVNEMLAILAGPQKSKPAAKKPATNKKPAAGK